MENAKKQGGWVVVFIHKATQIVYRIITYETVMLMLEISILLVSLLNTKITV